MIKKVFDNLISQYLKIPKPVDYPPDFSQTTIDIITKVTPFTMTSPERIFALCEAVKYIITNNILGDIVECGVWKGGSMMAVAETLISLGDQSRDLYLFDTFEGMSEPSEKDKDIQGNPALNLLNKSSKNDDQSIWCYAPIDEVRESLKTTNYAPEKIHLIQGKVEDTIPANSPENIALLRLDTDWYESTRHELIHLFPRLVSGGVIIIDDYGHWQGAKQAVDEYIQEHKIPLLLNRIDYTGRIGVVIKSS